MILKKLSDYVTSLEEALEPGYYLTKEDAESILKYTKLLQQKPELWMFVPCDDEGNVLKEPINPYSIEPQPNFGQDDFDRLLLIWNEYQQAEERVLFKGFYVEYESEVSIRVEVNPKLSIVFMKGRDKILLDVPGERSLIHTKTLEDLTPYNLELTKEI